MQQGPGLDFARTAVIGNTASGKSWLALCLGARLSLPVTHLDAIRWIDGDFARRQTVAKATAATCAVAQGQRWIIEGVYGWLIRPIIGRVTCLIWIDIPWHESRANLLARETARGADGNFEELETWSRAYWSRNTESSHAAHLSLFLGFDGSKVRLCSMAATTAFAQRLSVG